MIKDGKPTAQLEKSEVEKLSNLWLSSIIMYVVGESPSIGAVLRYIAKDWPQISKPKVFYHDV